MIYRYITIVSVRDESIDHVFSMADVVVIVVFDAGDDVMRNT